MTLSPRLRKALLTAHVTSSVGWLGAAAGFLAVAVAALTADDGDRVRGAYLAMEPMTTFVLVPLAVASSVTGVVQSLGTSWGLIRHYWVVVKLGLTIAAATVLLAYTRTISTLVDAAANPSLSTADLQVLAASPVLHAAGGVVVLVMTTTLSVYKPPGMTRRGQRQHRHELERRASRIPTARRSP